MPLADGFLLVDADGRFARLSWDDGDDALTVTPLSLRVPTNFDQFDADAPPAAMRRHFRVADLVVQDVADRVRVLVSHHFWHGDRGCWVVRVSEATLSRDSLTVGSPEWRTLFEAKPCLPMRRGIRAPPFQGLEMGGAMVLIDRTHLLVALGDQGFDGVNDELAVSQDPAADYGKTVLIDLDNGKVEHFSSGHRNPQGLVLDASGTIWLTEHGPQGGDELNRIERGGNYGWPLVTFGTQYTAPWPSSRTPGEHTGFHLPTFTWTPSIGPSSVIEAGSQSVPGWEHDLIVAALSGMRLSRVRVRDSRVIYVEPIPTGLTIRDVAQGAGGRIVLWNDEGVVVSVRPARQERSGARLFGLCSACHPVGGDRDQSRGPDLIGVFQRYVAAAPGFDFSPALKSAGGKWTEARLSEFLRDPQAFASGTTMQFAGMPDENERSMLIAHLRRF
ncbi:MAG: PQQ-dependent sugar dehydrogenase [Vicinamibacterales bacterium]